MAKAKSAETSTLRADATKQRSGETVTVACKVENGLMLRVFQMIETQESAPGGMRSVQMSQLVGDPIRINGTRAPFGKLPSWTVVAGFGITKAVPKDLWETWLEQNQDQEVVKRGLILAYDRADFAEGEARDRKGLLTGLQAIVPDADLRIPRSQGQRLQTEEDSKKRVQQGLDREAELSEEAA